MAELESGNAANRCAIGLDVGGTKIAGGVVTRDGNVQRQRAIPTEPKRGSNKVLADTVALAESLTKDATSCGYEIDGVGLCVPELVDLQGKLISASTVDWRSVCVSSHFSHLAPTFVEADSRAAALGEAIFGAGRPFKSFFFVTIGTGIGSCLVQDGRPYAGARGCAGTLASSSITTVCTECGKVTEPILEELASGPALVARYAQKCVPDETHFSTASSDVRSPSRRTSAEDVLAGAAAGDPIAVEVVESAGIALGATVGLMINVLDPEAVVIGGGLGLAGGLYWNALITSTREHIWSETNRNLPILPAACGVNAGLVGAAAVVWQRKS
ncbi:MAG: ROK family protein [Verrucomicrobia bacterium]|nr:ROK family protein [Verrucomicrobiota bacterium]